VRPPLEAVLFDYGHTLIWFDERPHSALMGAYEKVNELLGATLTQEVPAAQVLIEKVSKAVDEAIQRDYEAGREEEVEIAAIYDTALRGLGLTVEPRLIERVMELEQEGWLGSVHVGPDVDRTLQHLRGRGLRLALVSNAAYLPRLMTGQLEVLGLKAYFDGLTFSSEVGVRKPSPKIYADALDKVRVSPARALFIGDRVKEDVQGPQALGMLAVLTREFRQEDDGGVANFVVQRLGELPAIVDGLLDRPPSATTYNEMTSRD
jgi:putative hydrolase of the HAD superfamily